MNAVSAFLRLAPRQQAMALEAVAWLTLARVLVSHVPMRRWSNSVNASVPDRVELSGRRTLAQAVGWIVRKTARRLPFEAECLPRAMAARWMLSRRGVCSRVVFGVRRSTPGRPNAYHAWLTVDGERVIGGRHAETFAPLASRHQIVSSGPRRAGYGPGRG